MDKVGKKFGLPKGKYNDAKTMADLENDIMWVKSGEKLEDYFANKGDFNFNKLVVVNARDCIERGVLGEEL